MGEMVEFKSNGGTCTGYLAGTSGPGVIVIQEWWGLVPHITDIADRFADYSSGWVADSASGGGADHGADIGHADLRPGGTDDCTNRCPYHCPSAGANRFADLWFDHRSGGCSGDCGPGGADHCADPGDAEQ